MKKLIVFLGALAAYGQTVSLSDTLTNAVGGGSFTGRITVTLNAPGNASPLYYSTTSLTGWQAVYCLGVTGADCTTTAAAGTFAATLYANSTITPAGTSYSARFQPTKGASWNETWVVGASDTKLYQIRSTTVPTPTTTFTAGQLALATGSLLYGSSAGVGTALAAGTNGHILTLSGGYPTWAASTGGVSSITGTANQITASASTGAVTLSLPATITGLTSVTSTGFTGALTGNASTATALASTVASGRLWIGNGTGAPASDSLLNWDSATRKLGIGTATTTSTVTVSTANTSHTSFDLRHTDTAGFPGFNLYDSAGTIAASMQYGNTASGYNYTFFGSRNTTPLVFLAGSGFVERMRLVSTTGNLLIGTTSDLGYGAHLANKGTNGNLLVFDPTATTGNTREVVVAGQGQSTNLTEWRAYNATPLSGTLMASVNSAGDFTSGAHILTGGVYGGLYQSGLRFSSSPIVSWASSTNPLASIDLSLSRSAANTLQVGDGGANANGTLLAASWGTASGTRFAWNSGGGTVTIGNPYGTLNIAGAGEVNIGTVTTAGVFTLYNATATTGNTKLVVKAGQGQSTNLTEWQDYSGTVTTQIIPTGYIRTAFFQLLDSVYLSSGAETMENAFQLKWTNGSAGSTPDLHLFRSSANVLGIGSGSGTTGGGLLIEALKSTSGTRYVCVDTTGRLTSSATACSGT